MNKEELNIAKHLIQLAFEEDVASGDITTNNLIPQEERKEAFWKAKENGIIAGLQIAEMTFKTLDKNIEWNQKVKDGDEVAVGDVIVKFTGTYRAILTAERIALNFVQRLSGIATLAKQYTDRTKGTSAKILDTRKTLPAYRLLDKYAVRVGGATNHRIGLYDMVMIKDNHIDIAGGITNAVKQIRSKINANTRIEVETTNINQVKEAVAAGADIIMLDNMSNEEMSLAVSLIKNKAKTEASGNMNLDRIAEVAATGVDFISVGAITHSVKCLDISQRVL